MKKENPEFSPEKVSEEILKLFQGYEERVSDIHNENLMLEEMTYEDFEEFKLEDSKRGIIQVCNEKQ